MGLLGVVLKGPLTSASFNLGRQELRGDRLLTEEVVTAVPASLHELDFGVFVVHSDNCAAVLDLKRDLVFVCVFVELEQVRKQDV